MFKALRFFLRCGWKYDRLYIVEKALSQLTRAFVPLAATLLPKLIIDELMGARRPEALAFWTALVTGAILLANAATAFLDRDSFSHRLNIDASFGQELHGVQARADLASLEDPAYLDLKEKAERFTTCDGHGFGYLLDCALDIAGQCAVVAGISAVIAALNGWLIVLFAAMALLGGAAGYAARRKANALYDRVVSASRGWQYYASLFGDGRYGKEIRLNGIVEWLLGRERGFLGETIGLMKRQNNAFICADLIAALCGFAQQAAAYAWLCRGVLLGQVGIGDFAMYTAAVTTFAAALRRTMDSVVEIRRYDRWFDDLDRYLHLPATLREGPRERIGQGPRRIEFRDVGFRYPGQETWALRHLNLVLEPGEKLSVVGENGAGKSTFVKLLTRLYDPTEGVILLDGVDIRRLDVDEYMSLFSTVFQDFRLFSFSLRDNVAFGRPCPDRDVVSLLARAGFQERLTTLPEGVNTPLSRELDEHGFEPSGGEAQRIALARALCRNAPVVILDEPTAALDPRAEYELYARFSELTAGKSAVFISHRLSSARFCDRIAVFADGSLAEYGTHEELLARQGAYAELYGMQARLYREGNGKGA